MAIIHLTISAIYFALPMYVANLMPVIVSKLPFLDHPVDGGKLLNGQPILGKNKTLRGFFFGVIAGIAIGYGQLYLYQFSYFESISIVDYDRIPIVLFGFLMSFGALFGDSLKSFFKRRFAIQSGKPWVPFDQLDFLVGAMVFVSFVYLPDWTMLLTLLILTPFLHWGTNILGYSLGLKSVPW